MALTLKRVRWEARRRLEALGWLGASGIALVVFAVVFRLSAVSGLNAELSDLRAEAERLHVRYQMSLRQPASLRRGPADQLETFYEFFPAVGTLRPSLLRLYGAAEKHGLTLEVGKYKLVQEKGRRLARYQITLPVKGSYEQIRGFMAAVLNEMPAAAFEDIGLQRETIGSAALEASIKLSLFVRMENW